MMKNLLLLLFVLLVVGSLLIESPGSPGQRSMAPFKNNGCVQCHSRISSSLAMAKRYLDWQLSAHRSKGVACEKCHGGDAAASDPKKAHEGVLPISNPASRLYQSNVPETCGECHKAVAGSFVESAHYEKLKQSGLGPSCNSCHAHMASSIITRPSEGTTLCTFCHNSINGVLAPKPEIPRKAGAVLDSLSRTNALLVWVSELLEEAREKRIDVAKEREDTRLDQMLLEEAKIGWHAFNLDGPKIKADKAFEEGVRIKDSLMRKLGGT